MLSLCALLLHFCVSCYLFSLNIATHGVYFSEMRVHYRIVLKKLCQIVNNVKVTMKVFPLLFDVLRAVINWVYRMPNRVQFDYINLFLFFVLEICKLTGCEFTCY